MNHCYFQSVDEYLTVDETPRNQFHHQSAKDYYRLEFYYGTLDLVLNGLKIRFSRASCEILRAFAALHPSTVIR